MWEGSNPLVQDEETSHRHEWLSSPGNLCALTLSSGYWVTSRYSCVFHLWMKCLQQKKTTAREKEVAVPCCYNSLWAALVLWSYRDWDHCKIKWWYIHEKGKLHAWMKLLFNSVFHQDAFILGTSVQRNIFLLKLQQIYNLIKIKREIHLNRTTLLNRTLVKQLNENINW